MTIQRRTILGFLGDVNFPEYDGAVVYRQGGREFLDYVEYYDDESHAVVGTVDVPERKSWRSEWWAKNLEGAARSTGEDVADLVKSLDSKNPMERASVLYYTIRGYSGFENEYERRVHAKKLPAMFAWATRSKSAQRKQRGY